MERGEEDNLTALTGKGYNLRVLGKSRKREISALHETVRKRIEIKVFAEGRKETLFYQRRGHIQRGVYNNYWIA